MTTEACMRPNGNTYLDDMFNMKDQSNVDAAEGISEVTNFYVGCNVLITGGSGFLGKLLLEKLLRTCPNMGKVYMLLRAKKGKTPAQRLKEQFNDPLYDRLRQEQPNFASQVVIIEGDTGEEDLGLSFADRDFLVKNTHVVFHGAATVRFDETLRKAVNVNVRGAKMMLLLAKEMKNLKAFVHISTAYAHCTLDCIEEKYYKPAMDPNEAIAMVAKLDDEALQRMAPRIIGAWPNTYAFSKSVSEEAVRQYSRGMPISVVRPSIVLPTMKDPVVGWSDNTYGATGAVVGIYVSLLRVFYCDLKNVAELIPADIVINNIIVAAWDINKLNQKKLAVEQPVGQSDFLDVTTQPLIYNCVSSCQKPLTWNEYLHVNLRYADEIPSRLTLWYRVFRPMRYRWLYILSKLFLHLIPAIIVDTLARLTGRKPRQTYQKVHKYSSIVSYFCNKEWKFNNDNVLKLWERTSLTDQTKFDFNVGNFDWSEYLVNHIRGIRVYVLKDPMTTLDQARIKYKLLTRLHFTIVTILCCLLAWLFTSFVGISLL
ncbi:hypothetical protein TSAR_005861 [Trichomalopsis sarcophagae]|uniref:Fatty acyl-CoA reductase n=1 Tax=Trichomalopsis sarcophagae TaxID=543379 RepID=A0A232FLM2_9HYME|nr:hypothetical protein TSAR_005861 [Trichomalopsis sarcophagae]